MSTNRNTDSVIADISVGDEESRRIEDIRCYELKTSLSSSQIYLLEVSAKENNQNFENFLSQSSNLSRIPCARNEINKTFKFLFYENRFQTKQLESIVESFKKNYNFIESEVLNLLKEQLLFDIQAMGFKNTKTKTEGKK